MSRHWKIHATVTAATIALVLAGCSQQTLRNQANGQGAAFVAVPSL